MTLAGIVSSVLFSPNWKTDERLLMSFWSAGLLVGASASRACGKSGIFSAGFGAVVGCLLVHKFGPMAVHEDLSSAYLMFIIVVGWSLAVILVAAYHELLTGGFERLLSAGTTTRNLLLFAIVTGALAFVGNRVLDDTWRPVAELRRVPQIDGVPLRLHLSAAGNVLVLHASRQMSSFEGEHHLEIFRKQGSRFAKTKLKLDRPLPDGALTLRPDGEQVFMVDRLLSEIRVRDLQLSASATSIPIAEDVNQIAFHPDNRQLFVTTITPRIQRLRTIDLARPAIGRPELFPFAGRLYVSPSGQLIARVTQAESETREAGIELGEFELGLFTREGELLARLPDVSQLAQPLFSPDDQRVAIGERVWSRRSNEVASLPNRVRGFAGNQHVVVLRDGIPPVWRGYVPEWFTEMPFVRHAFRRGYLGQLLLVDLSTGKVVARSLKMPGWNDVVVSHDGRTVAGVMVSGQIQLWSVPQRFATTGVQSN